MPIKARPEPKPFRIQARLKELGIPQKYLIPELQKCGIEKVSYSELSVALTGDSQAPKSQAILSAANEIVSEWEQGQAITQ